jgi:hypothetical protein
MFLFGGIVTIMIVQHQQQLQKYVEQPCLHHLFTTIQTEEQCYNYQQTTQASGKVEKTTPSSSTASSSSSSNVVPYYIIEQAKNRSKSVNEMQSPYNILAYNHPAFSLLEDFDPLDEWKTYNFPNISIVGLPKAGTSQLYQILTSHTDLVRYHYRKEFCFHLPYAKKDRLQQLLNTSESNLLSIKQSFYEANIHQQKEPWNIHSIERWYMLTYGGYEDGFVDGTQLPIDSVLFPEDSKPPQPLPPLQERKTTVNGCHDVIATLLQRQYVQRLDNEDDKLILLVRDPADWLWSAWNFWYEEEEDLQPPKESDWAFAPHQYRSPELFHQLLRGGDQRLNSAKILLQRYRDEMSWIASYVVSHIQRESNLQVLVMKNEDMTPENFMETRFLERLAEFVGVSMDGFDTTVVESFANCGDIKGTDTKCKSSSGGSYAITDHRPMLEETKELIYLHFSEVCKLWAEQFQIYYDDCLSVRKKYFIG